MMEKIAGEEMEFDKKKLIPNSKMDWSFSKIWRYYQTILFNLLLIALVKGTMNLQRI